MLFGLADVEVVIKVFFELFLVFLDPAQLETVFGVGLQHASHDFGSEPFFLLKFRLLIDLGLFDGQL